MTTLHRRELLVAALGALATGLSRPADANTAWRRVAMARTPLSIEFPSTPVEKHTVKNNTLGKFSTASMVAQSHGGVFAMSVTTAPSAAMYFATAGTIFYQSKKTLLNAEGATEDRFISISRFGRTGRRLHFTVAPRGSVPAKTGISEFFFKGQYVLTVTTMLPPQQSAEHAMRFLNSVRRE